MDNRLSKSLKKTINNKVKSKLLELLVQQLQKVMLSYLALLREAVNPIQHFRNVNAGGVANTAAVDIRDVRIYRQNGICAA